MDLYNNEKVDANTGSNTNELTSVSTKLVNAKKKKCKKIVIWRIISLIMAGPIGVLICILCEYVGRLYITRSFRGNAQESIRLINAPFRKRELRDRLMISVEQLLEERNIPAKVCKASVKVPGFFRFNILPMIVIKNTELRNKYFNIGMVVNDDTILFTFLGSSRENTKYNLSKMYKDEGTISGEIKGAMYKANEFKLQNEANWQQDVLNCINSILE